MSGNKSKRLAILGKVLLVVGMTILVSTPSAWAHSKYRSLYQFREGVDGGLPYSSLIFDTAGNLYGVALDGGAHTFGAVFELTPNTNGSWTENVLYSFCSLTNCADGASPNGRLIFDKVGNLYGATLSGGANGSGGVVFELIPNTDGSWTESVLFSFCSLTNCSDGSDPNGILIFDSIGNLEGNTVSGGANDAGVVFKLTPNTEGTWTESVLHNFCSFKNCGDGSSPQSGLILDASGNLYGTTQNGGNLNQCSGGCGVVFRLTPTGEDRVLHRFTGNDGAFPAVAGVTLDQAGNLYGTTEEGGSLSQCNGSGCGVIFRLAPNTHRSWTEKVLHRFTGGADGGFPVAGVTFDAAGNLYGTAEGGGNVSFCILRPGCGVVFKLAQNSKGEWHEMVLYDFLDRPGAHPFAGLIFDTAGNVYGTTVGDDKTTFGSVFEITP